MPDQDEKLAVRRKVVAAILAQGALRCRRRAGVSRPSGRQKLPESSQNCLERSESLRLPVPAGYGQENVSEGRTTT